MSTRSREFIARSREEQRPVRLYGPAIPHSRAAGSARPRPGVQEGGMKSKSHLSVLLLVTGVSVASSAIAADAVTDALALFRDYEARSARSHGAIALCAIVGHL